MSGIRSWASPAPRASWLAWALAVLVSFPAGAGLIDGGSPGFGPLNGDPGPGSRASAANRVALSIRVLDPDCPGLAIAGDAVYLPVGVPLELQATGGLADEREDAAVAWSAPGGSPAAGLGATFRTVFAEPGRRVVEARSARGAASMPVLVYQVALTELTFDWGSGGAMDALDIRANRTTDVLKPEWVPGVRNHPAAYIRSLRPTVKARFTVSPPSVTRLRIWANAPAPWGGMAGREVAFAGGLSNPEQIPFLWKGHVPSGVRQDEVTLNWWACNPDGHPGAAVHLAASGPHTFYTLLSAPRPPMAEPWTEVLDYACDYAAGTDSQEEIVAALVTQVYWNSTIIYYPAYSYSSGYSSINLTAFLDDLANEPSMYVDCRDCSHWAHILSNSLGLTGEYNTLGWSFDTNYVRDMGRDYWHTWSFNFHQVGWFWNDKVGDMAAAADGDGNPTAPPHTEFLSVGNVTLEEYLDLFSEDDWIVSAGEGTCTVY